MPALTGIAGDTTTKVAPISAAVLGDNTVVAAVASQRIKVYTMVLVPTLGTSTTWKSGATALSGAIPLAALAVLFLSATAPNFLLATNPGDPLVLTLGLGTLHAGWLVYTDSDPS